MSIKRKVNGQWVECISIGDATISTPGLMTANDKLDIYNLKEQVKNISNEDKFSGDYNDLLNKPFGEMSTTVLDTIFDDTETGGWPFIMDNTSTTLRIGDTYTVIWNGVPYELICNSCGDGPGLGNLVNFTGEDNGLPFAIVRLHSEGIWGANIIEPSDNNTYSCKIIQNKINTLDNKYLEILETIDSEYKIKEKYINNAAKDYLILKDHVNSFEYVITMRNGTLVSSCAVARIEITTPPTKTTYEEGEVFDNTGMVVTAICQDGSAREIDTYMIICSGEFLTVKNSTVLIKYEECGKIYMTEIDVSIIPFDPETRLIDFEYKENSDGTYTLTGWKGTMNGISSTELIVPNSSIIRI